MLFLLVLICWPVAELFVAIEVAEAIGVLPMLLLLLAGWPLGLWALRSQGRVGMAAAQRRRRRQADSRPRGPQRRARAARRLLLMVPGFITDVLGLLLLLPPTRALVRVLLAAQPPEPPRRAGRARSAAATLRRRLDRHRHRPAPAALVTRAPLASRSATSMPASGARRGCTASRRRSRGRSVPGSRPRVPRPRARGSRADGSGDSTADGLELALSPAGDGAGRRARPEARRRSTSCAGCARRPGGAATVVDASVGARRARRRTRASSTRSRRVEPGSRYDERLGAAAGARRARTGHDDEVTAALVEAGARPAPSPTRGCRRRTPATACPPARGSSCG